MDMDGPAAVPLSPDQPRTDPADDLFGHAPFAQQLAKSIGRQTGDAGMVLALHGPWGSGKTTVLGYVRHFLRASPATKDIVVVDFNPWWFAGRDDLAQAFLRQLQAALPNKSKKLKEVGTLLGEFSEGIGGLLDLTGLTGGAGAAAGKVVGRILKRQPKDVPALKEKIASALRKAAVRILVVVDDIDRLDDVEVRQLFTVIKALADFPYVTYLLAFDRAVASKAIEAESHLPGDRYLEKIVQVPFQVPAVDRVALRNALFKRLDAVLTGTPEGAFDGGWWTNVYFGGLDPLIQVPRDIVRLTNTLAVTYPAVLGEVNAVDFIAIEAIRVFVPTLYDTLREHPEKFAGHTPESWGAKDRDSDKAFHDEWVADVPERWRASARALMERLFPKLERTSYGSDWLSEWRRQRRVCHPDVFPVYFRWSQLPGAVSHAEMASLVTSLAVPSEFKERLLAAREVTRADGIPKARELLERLMDFVQKEIPDNQVPDAIEALLDIGDDLIEPREQRGGFDSSDARVTRPAYHLLKRVSPGLRLDVVGRAIRGSRGLVIPATLIRYLDGESRKSDGAVEAPLLKTEDVQHLKAAWIERAKVLLDNVMVHTEFRLVLESWRSWGDAAELQARCDKLIESDAGLLLFLHAFLGKVQIASGRGVKQRPRLNPEWLKPFINTDAAAMRLKDLLERGDVPEVLKLDVSQFLKERGMLAAGKNPDAIGWPDDD